MSMFYKRIAMLYEKIKRAIEEHTNLSSNDKGIL